ncbi:MAG TPA: magnesium transporter [Gemmatimonadota bacterium]|nr:magnesium transporter [Gemmatimonadota bacterium]
MNDMREVRLDELRALLAGGEAELGERLADLHASDVADLIEGLDEDERLVLLRRLRPEVAADALSEMEEVERPAELLLQLDPGRIAAIVEEMADDDAADIIGGLDPDLQAEVLSTVSVPDAAQIEELLHYPEDTAGGIMTREVLAVREDLTAGEAIAEIRRQASGDSDFYTIFVVGATRELAGVVSLQDLVLSDPETPIAELTDDPPASVPVSMDQEEVGRLLSRYNIASIGVVDGLGRLVGRVTFDDVIDVMEMETTEDILRFAAVSDEEQVRGSTVDAIRSRLPWLVANLFTAVAAASVVYFFQGTIEQIVVLAAVMPIIAGMGGNAGTQALAVTIRRIALSDESLAERWQVIGKELMVGLVNGFVIGTIVAIAGLLLADDPLFGIVVMLAMWGNLIVASAAGAFIPIFLESLGADPAVASSIFVTTLTDLVGFFLLLGLATAMLL